MISYTKACLDNLKVGAAKGSYILIIELDSAKIINVGSLGMVPFPKGFYAYLGSALGGFKSRLNRHLAQDRKPKWHIDYLLNEARGLQVVLCETEQRLECLLSQVMIDKLPSIPGFGSSDCQCRSHLYLADKEPHLELVIKKAIAEIDSPRRFSKQIFGFYERSKLDYANY